MNAKKKNELPLEKKVLADKEWAYPDIDTPMIAGCPIFKDNSEVKDFVNSFQELNGITDDGSSSAIIKSTMITPVKRGAMM